ncbi:MAG: hypothetical protein WD737_04125, partial [Gemmatimonadota bacterium]
KPRTLIFTLVLLAVVLFAIVNWPLFAQATPLNLLVGTVVAPLGVVMLAILAGVTILYLIFLAKAETEVLMGSRKANRELEEARKLADRAEESRITALREEVQTGLETLDAKIEELLRRVDSQGRVVVREETALAPETDAESNRQID